MNADQKELDNRVKKMGVNSTILYQGKVYKTNDELKKLLRKRTYVGLIIIFVISFVIANVIHSPLNHNRKLVFLISFLLILLVGPLLDFYIKHSFPENLLNYLIPIDGQDQETKE